ncbi:MAG: hypothetical protein C0418_03970, partial [Coriobacteriaceae bacterium]|nr:hypothetical protein [Coriobacteriaceae bacterium]
AGLWLAAGALDVLGLGAAATYGGALLVTLAGALAPGLGIALALLATVAAVWTLAGPVASIVTLVAAGAFWWFLGREGRGTAIMPLTSPFFGAVSLGLAPPLVLGYAFRPLLAAASSTLAGLGVMTAAAASGTAAPYLDVPLSFLAHPWGPHTLDGLRTLATTPGAYVALVGWAAAGAMSSIVCARATRPAGAAGVAAGLGWLAVAYLAWGVIDPSFGFPGVSLLRHGVGSLILMALVIAAGPPARAEDGSRKHSRGAETTQ